MDYVSFKDSGKRAFRSRRSLLSFTALAMGAILAGCGGGGGGGGAIPAAASAPGQMSAPGSTGGSVLNAGASASPSSSPAPGTINTAGTVAKLITGGFDLNTGSPHGYVYVYTSSSTTFSGAQPYVGELVSVAGTGSWTTQLQAVSVAQLTSLAAATASPSPSPTPVPVLAGPAHIQTWAFDEYWAEGANASSSAVASYLTYAEGGDGNAKAQLDCSGTPKSCSSVFYYDPNLIYSSASCPVSGDASFLASAGADESWFVHEAGYTDFAHRAQGTYSQSCNGATIQIPVYLANEASPNTAAYYANYLRAKGDKWDDYFMDDTSSRVLYQTYGPGGGFCQDVLPSHHCTTTQEYPTDDALLQAHESFVGGLTHNNGTQMQMFFNGVSFTGQTPYNLNLMTMGAGKFVGAVCENCVVNAGTVRPTMFASVLNAMAQIDQIPNAAFIELSTGYSPAGSAAQVTQRLITTAMAWLGYSEGHTVVFPNLEDNTQNLAVWPEDMLYPSSPVQSMTNGAADIAVTTGVYRREFAACSNNRAAIGPCAAIVNATSSNVIISSAWLTQTYGHVVALSGGDILSGGSVSLSSTTFSPNVTILAPGAGVLLVQ